MPLRHSGSAGGLYTAHRFDAWAEIVPFDRRDPTQRELRLLLGNLRDMQSRHFAYVGRLDGYEAVDALAREEAPRGSKLTVIPVPGDHHTSLAAALAQYLRLIKEEPAP